jgi:phage FluMu protein Com
MKTIKCQKCGKKMKSRIFYGFYCINKKCSDYAKEVIEQMKKELGI